MALNKKLEKGLCARAWTFEKDITQGIIVGIKSEGNYEPVFHIESVKSLVGSVNRIIINKTRLKKAGFVIVEG